MQIFADLLVRFYFSFLSTTFTISQSQCSRMCLRLTVLHIPTEDEAKKREKTTQLNE